jgi:hypothetical protein
MMVTKPSTPSPSAPPGYNTPVSYAERVNLTYNPQNDRFEVAFVFDETGPYQLEFNACDASGQQALPVTAAVRNGSRFYLPVVLK